jgi:uncharacterized protein YfaP (DUF2135 family)
MLLLFVVTTLINAMMISPKTNEGAKIRSKMLIVLTWDDDAKDDVDLWLKDPLGNITFFRVPEQSFSNLDRDDLGDNKDLIQLPDGTMLEAKINQEVMSIREWIPGRWTINVHMYKDKSPDSNTPATVTVEKVNPYQLVYTKSVVFEDQWQEFTIVGFDMGPNGELSRFSEDAVAMVSTKLKLGE